MTRRKIKLAFIRNETERKASYKKRKKGLMKKMEEISTLCGIESCAILYGPYDDEPEIWPPSPRAVQNLLLRFKTLPERYKRVVNQEAFTKQRVDKMQEQIRKQEKDNREKELTDVIYRCLGGEELQNFRGVVDFNEMDWLINRNVKEVCRRIALLKKHDMPQPSLPLPEMALGTSSDGGNNESSAAPEMPVNEMQTFTASPTRGSMVSPEMPLHGMQNVTWSSTNASTAATEMPINDMQNVTWSTNNASMVAPYGMLMNRIQNVTWSTNNASVVAHGMHMNGMQNVAWSTNNASMVAHQMLMNEMQNVAWPSNYGSMVAPHKMLMNEMQNATWFSNNASSEAPHEMLMNEMQNLAFSANNASMVAPEMPMSEMQNPTWSANSPSMVASEMPMNELQRLTLDLDMLSLNQQPWLSGFIWNDPFFQSMTDNNGAGPTDSVP